MYICFINALNPKNVLLESFINTKKWENIVNTNGCLFLDVLRKRCELKNSLFKLAIASLKIIHSN